MAMASSIAKCTFSAYGRARTQFSSPIHNPFILNFKDQSLSQSSNFGSLNHTRSRVNAIEAKAFRSSSYTAKRIFVVYTAPPGSDVPPEEAPLTSKPPSDSLIDRILRALLTDILPFLSGKLGQLRLLKEKLRSEVDKLEILVNAVEEMAEQVDNATEDIADNLPQGNLKNILDTVENMAEKTAQTADTIGDFIDKVQEAEDQIEYIVDSLDGETNESLKK